MTMGQVLPRANDHETERAVGIADATLHDANFHLAGATGIDHDVPPHVIKPRVVTVGGERGDIREWCGEVDRVKTDAIVEHGESGSVQNGADGAHAAADDAKVLLRTRGEKFP